MAGHPGLQPLKMLNATRTFQIPGWATAARGALEHSLSVAARDHSRLPAAVRLLVRPMAPVRLELSCLVHRVIETNGSLTGYGGGIERNSWLLEQIGRAHV